jgi:hypothetical protein
LELSLEHNKGIGLHFKIELKFDLKVLLHVKQI